MPRWEVVQGSSLKNQCSARDVRTASSHPTKFCASDTCNVNAYILDFTQDQCHGCRVVSAASEQSPSSWTSCRVEYATAGRPKATFSLAFTNDSTSAFLGSTRHNRDDGLQGFALRNTWAIYLRRNARVRGEGLRRALKQHLAHDTVPALRHCDIITFTGRSPSKL